MEPGFIGPAVVLGIALLGGVGGYFTYKAKVDELNRRIAEKGAEILDLKRMIEAGARVVNDLELRLEREFVKKNDLAAVEARLGQRIGDAVADLKGEFRSTISALGKGLRSSAGREA